MRCEGRLTTVDDNLNGVMGQDQRDGQRTYPTHVPSEVQFPVEALPLASAKHEEVCPWSILVSLAFVSCVRLFPFLYIW
jgi:hypothetical protein